MEWWQKVIIIIAIMFLLGIYAFITGTHKAVHEVAIKPWIEKRRVCAEWQESFPDKRLMEIVRKDVDGQTFEEIGEFYGVSGECIEKRADKDRELYDRLKAEYISRNY